MPPTSGRSATERHRDQEDAQRGHSLTIDHGWQEVAQTALDFVKRFVPAMPG